MKRIKVLMMSALVIASVGGALAFKAQNFSVGLKCGTSATSCPTTQTTRYTFNDQSFIQDFYCTTSGGNTAVCLSVTTE